MPVIRTLSGMLRYGGFIPTVPGLTSMARRLAINRILQNALFAGIPMPSGNKALQLFRQYGLGIKRADFQQKYTQTKNMYDSVIKQGKLDKPGMIPDNLISVLNREKGKKYTTVFSREYQDPITGEWKTEYKSITHSQKWRTDTAETHMREVLSKYETYSDEDLADFTFLYTAQRKGRG